MSGNNKLFVNTNVLLYFLKGDKKIIEIISDKLLFASFVTELELLAFPIISNESENNIRGLLDKIQIININSEIKEKTIEIRRKSNLKLPDAIIAATSLYLKLPLLTADKQFKTIDQGEIIIYEV